MRLLYFAQVREMVGQYEEELDPPQGIETLGDLIGWLGQRGGGYRHMMAMENLRMAINQEFADRDSSLEGAHEIAFFPPMTGG